MECSVEGCNKNKNNDTIYSENSKFGRRLCNKHYLQMFNKGYIEDEIEKEELICEVCGATEDDTCRMYPDSNQYGRTLCNKHYLQLNQRGKIYRSMYEPNEIKEKDNYALIFLYNRGGKKVAETKIDKGDIELVKEYKWSLNSEGYVINNTNKIFLHRLILGIADEEPSYDRVTDHINRDGLDNRRANLRIVPQELNAVNKSIRSNNTSGVTGVSFYHGRWHAELKFKGERVFRKSFENKKDAIKARKEAEVKYFGEFRPDYLPEELKEN